MLICNACRRNEVIWPIMVCWYCRQAGVKIPRMSAARRHGQPSWRYRWTAAEDELLRRVFPHSKTPDLMDVFPGRSIDAIENHAHFLGIRKTEECWAAIQRENGRRVVESGRGHRFKPGLVPHNKGVKGWKTGGRSAETRFKKGQLAGAAQKKWQPIGTVVVDPDGYHKIKVSDDRAVASRFNWRFCHVLLWEQHHGPVPAGHAVVFKDGKKDRIVIENLECVSRAELMRRNTIHRASLPKELRQVILQIGGLRRRITLKRRKLNEDPDA